MPRYFLRVEYDGGPYVGWQRQKPVADGPPQPSVQEALEDAGRRLTGAPAACVAAGRTDAGVHALAMGVHIDLAKSYPDDTVMNALNAHMANHPIAVLSAQSVPPDFSARFSCRQRHYLYRITSRRAPAVINAGRVWHVAYPLDAAKMHEASQLFLGTHDFTTFRSVHCQAKNPVKSIDTIAVREVDEEIHLTCSAISFMHNQIRSFAGTLERVGAGRWTIENVAEALAAKDRAACGRVAPPYGLYFVKADYDEEAFAPSPDQTSAIF